MSEYDEPIPDYVWYELKEVVDDWRDAERRFGPREEWDEIEDEDSLDELNHLKDKCWGLLNSGSILDISDCLWDDENDKPDIPKILNIYRNMR